MLKYYMVFDMSCLGITFVALWTKLYIVMELSATIKQQAKQHGLTTQMLADKLGIARPVLSSQINGNPTIATLEKIANAIGCDVSDFFKHHDEQQNKVSFVCSHCGKINTIRLIQD